MARAQRGQTAATARIYQLLKTRFTKLPAQEHVVYQYNAAIRIRIIDDSFRGQTVDEREDSLVSLLNALPLKMRTSVTALLLLTPEEAADPRNTASKAFDEESPSR